MNFLFTRLVDILKPNFFTKLEKEKPGKTWGFWFFWNTVFAVGVAIWIFFSFPGPGSNEFLEIEEELSKAIPDQVEVTMQGGQLSLENIKEPIIFEDETEGMLFVIDTEIKDVSSYQDMLKKAPKGFIVSTDQIIVKKNAFETRNIDFSAFEQSGEDMDFSFTGAEAKGFILDSLTVLKPIIVVVSFIGIWIFLNIIRLLTALWWTLVFWIVGLIWGIKRLNFGRVYLATLNFYIVPLVLEYILVNAGFKIPFSTTIIFAVLFLLNFDAYKKSKDNLGAKEKDEANIKSTQEVDKPIRGENDNQSGRPATTQLGGNETR